MLQEHGAVMVGGKQIASTIRCCHCGGHFIAVPGQEVHRCMNCDALVCGPGCFVCVPMEKMLERLEVRHGDGS